MTIKTPEQIAAEVATDWDTDGQTRDQDVRLAIAAIEADRAQLREALNSYGPVPGFRAYRLATTDELIEAWAWFEGQDVTLFIDAWNAYTVGEDFACPESLDGIHYVTDGSCDNCGDKNREGTPTTDQKETP